MFLYVFYIGGMALVAIAACYVIFVGHDSLSPNIRGRVSNIGVAIICMALMTVLPYGGYVHTEMSNDVTTRNNEFASIERSILKLDFDRLCTFDGHLATHRTPPENSFDCLERDGIRVVSKSNGNGLRYFVIDDRGTPVRWRGMVDYPVPFTFSKERQLLSPTLVRKAFLRGAPPPSRQSATFIAGASEIG
jgi:hypothetical protein